MRSHSGSAAVGTIVASCAAIVTLSACSDGSCDGASPGNGAEAGQSER